MIPEDLDEKIKLSKYEVSKHAHTFVLQPSATLSTNHFILLSFGNNSGCVHAVMAIKTNLS